VTDNECIVDLNLAYVKTAILYNKLHYAFSDNILNHTYNKMIRELT